MDPGELARLYRRGVDSQAAGRFDDAIRCWEMVQASSPGYRGVDQALVREYLTRGMESFSTGHLDEAIHSWEQVLRIDPADTRAQGYLARAREQAARRRQMFGAAQ
jgi:tetratricopeptide (TPR) repeat protein